MQALAEYGDSSSSSTETDEETKQEEIVTKSQLPSAKLPKPTLEAQSLHTSVFSNPFAEAELAKAAILEKHVKMVPGKQELQMINGRRICWNYRKGRCRFGHNCKYAHDTDLQKTEEELDAEKKVKSGVRESSGSLMGSALAGDVEAISSTDDAFWEGSSDRRKLKRPGLSAGLVPGKKVLKMYKDQKIKDGKK